MRYLLLALLVTGCVSTEDVRKIAREEAERVIKEQGTAAQAELDRLKADVAAKEAEAQKVAVFDGCCKNLRNIGSAMEMYSIDAKGRYPLVGNPVTALVPSYMKEPVCAAGGKYVAVTAQGPDLYTVVCSGGNHPGSAPNFPQYTSVTGLIK